MRRGRDTPADLRSGWLAHLLEEQKEGKKERKRGWENEGKVKDTEGRGEE